MTKKATHKVEILRMGDKTYDQALDTVSRIFLCDPPDLGIMRTDATADVLRVPVDWFKRHVHIRAKQTRREHFNVESGLMVTKGVAETLYGGVKPNQIRIYNKSAELEKQFEKYTRQFVKMARGLPDSTEIQASSFEDLYGYARGELITRVERQIGGRDLAKLGLTNLPSLLRGTELDPFSQMVFFDVPWFTAHEIEGMNWRRRCIGEHIHSRVETLGLSSTLTWMRASLGNKFYRAKKEFAPFLRLSDNVVGIDAAGLRNAYQASTYRQLRRAA